VEPVSDLDEPGDVPGAGGGDVSVLFDDNRAVVLLRGDIDLRVNDDLEYAGREAIDARLPVVADVRNVEMIDSIGVSFLIRLAAAARHNDVSMVMVGPSPRVEELLRLIGAADLFTWAGASSEPPGTRPA
jgi:anti-anti-sigma factor